jgi:hypothetical protein
VRTNLAIALCLMLGSGYLLWHSFQMLDMLTDPLGSWFLPRVVLGVLLLLAVIMALQTFQSRPQAETRTHAGLLWGIVLTTLAYVAGLRFIGFLPVTPLYFVGMAAWTAGPRRLAEWQVWISGCVMTLVFHTLFVKLLNVPLPKGVFGD